MSNEPITCRYTFSPKEYSHAMGCYWRHSWAKWLLLILPFIFGGQAYAEFFPAKDAPPVTSLSIFFDFLPPIAILVFIVLLVKFGGQFAFRRSAFCNKEMIFMLSEDGVSVKSALSESALKWAIYARATESGSGFALFYQGSRMFNWLSKSGFSNEDEIKRCRELLRQKVKDSKKLFVY